MSHQMSCPDSWGGELFPLAPHLEIWALSRQTVRVNILTQLYVRH